MRYKALHDYTAKLPLLELETPNHYIGQSTSESIHSGVVNGLVYEMDGFIDEYKAKYPNFIIILTGGDTVFLAKRLKNTIFANSNFLIESLNQTFQYNNKCLLVFVTCFFFSRRNFITLFFLWSWRCEI
jgi:type III pantothenate kinase